MRKAMTAYIANLTVRLSDTEPRVHAVEVAKGSKYYTVMSPDRFKGMRFSSEDQWEDRNGNNGHLEHTEYSPEYILYENVHHATAYVDREIYLREVREVSLNKLDLESLREIFMIIRSSKGSSHDVKQRMRYGTDLHDHS